MRTTKFILFFILISGNIVLLANWNSIFNPKSNVTSTRELTLKDSLSIFWDLKRECDQCRADILEFVRKRNISGCRSHSGWEKYLSSNERTQVESLLCMDKHSSEAKRRIQEYLNGKQFYSWKDIKDANNQVTIILNQYEKEREIGRSEMLNLVRKMCWYDNDSYIINRKRYEEFAYFREHSAWKFLSREEQSAVESIYKVLKEKYEPLIKLDNVVGLAIATRPDAITEECLDYLEDLSKRTNLIVELGLLKKYNYLVFY